ncbi:uncharacterized protein RJT20DRAFT_153462 [Scheffersomyces xylosifermentans]|uniref:uncharacterized protein n=1 Tax=Scheffersomyces xylosifermentans TaxID=1304137 RepID=UPI00315D0258
MCRPADCPSCHGKTWMGCGQHIAYAMSQSPKDQWCKCVSSSGADSGEYPPKSGDGILICKLRLSKFSYTRKHLVQTRGFQYEFYEVRCAKKVQLIIRYKISGLDTDPKSESM